MTVAPVFQRKVYERNLEPSEETGQIESFDDFSKRVCEEVEKDDTIVKANCSIQFLTTSTAVVIWRGYDFNRTE